MASTLARNDLARAFLFEAGVLRASPVYKYYPCAAVDALSQDFGEVTRIECPDPYKYGSFIEVDSVPGEIGRLTTTLTTRMPRNEVSYFRKLATQGCSFDLHLHFGLCARPTDFNTYDKVMVFEDVSVTSYGTDPLSVLASGDRAEINETIDISVGKYYEVVPLGYAETDTVNVALASAIIDSVYADVQSCGIGCNDSSSGCEVMFAIDADGDLIMSENGGTTWALNDDAWGTVTIGIGYLAGYLWTYNTATNAIISATKEDALANVAPASTAASPGVEVPADLANGVGYGLVVGSNGFVGVVRSPASGFEDTYTGSFTTEDYSVVNFNPYMDIALIGGTNNAILYTADGIDFETVTGPTAQAAVNVTAVLPISEKKWLVGYADGDVYATDNAGGSWTLLAVPGGANAVVDLAMSTTHVLWMIKNNVLYQSIDGGASWLKQPNSKKAFPTSSALNDVLICPYDVNRVNVFGADSAVGFHAVGTPA